MRSALFATALALGVQPALAAEFHPARDFAPPPDSLAIEDGVVQLVARGFTYETADGGSTWTVSRQREAVRAAPTLAFRRFHTDTAGVQTIFQCLLGRDEARLSVIRYDGSRLEPIGEVLLYDRWSVDAVARRLEPRRVLVVPGDTLPRAANPAPALLTSIEAAGSSLWLGIGWQDLKLRGVGGLLRHELTTRKTALYRTPEMERGSVVRIALVPSAVWLALEVPAAPGKRTHELLRFDPASLGVKDFTSALGPETGPIVGMAVFTDTVWAARGAFVARCIGDGTASKSWRVFPRVRVALRDTLSNVPGRPSPRAIPSGSYEVLGGSADSLLVRTADGAEGWIPPGRDTAAVVVLRDTPEPKGAVSAWFPAGTPLEPVALRTADGWQRARVRAGWIPRGVLVPAPAIDPVSK